MPHLLSIDQGTTSSRAVIYDHACRQIASAQQEFTQHFPRSGWVEHDPNEIWQSVRKTIRAGLRKASLRPGDIAAIGITNQRETVLIWDRRTGEPLHHAIVWQDRRTAPAVEKLREQGNEEFIQKRTGLLLDPYFSASKISWLLNHIPGARKRAHRGGLAVGTIDSWLVWKLTEGQEHLTDLSNASRTMLMDLRRSKWDQKLLELFKIPAELLPRIVPNSGELAITSARIFGARVPICGLIGDQQSALFGQLCTRPGSVKCTYGTGCFMLMHTGKEPVQSRHRLLSTVAWQIGKQPTEFALEGSVFSGGSAIQWLRDGLGLIKNAAAVNPLAEQVPDSGGAVLVPAFTGLGAPYWDSAARGGFLGISRGTTAAHLARATLEGIAFQVTDLIHAMEADSGHRIRLLKVDGGACASDLLMQRQADFLGQRVERPLNLESTALGAALMAGLGAGLWPSIRALEKTRAIDRVFRPEISRSQRRDQINNWHRAVERTLNWMNS